MLSFARHLRLLLSTICCLASISLSTPSLAKGSGSKESSPPKKMTAEAAVAEAESALDSGRIGLAEEHAQKLQKTRGLSKEMLRRVDAVVARCNLFSGDYTAAEKIFSRLHKDSPDDDRISEWYARALEGAGRDNDALPIFTQLLAKDALSDGDSYWALAQLERKQGKTQEALTHAETALQKPIVLQSDELEKAIKTFIGELKKK